MYFLGIDGGGTKTEFLVISEKGKILGHTIMASCHYRQCGYDGFKDIIYTGIQEVCRASRISLGEIDFVFLGLPGYGEDKKAEEKLLNVVNNILNGTEFICGNDSMAGLAGSLACGTGINIVAGTGSIALGVRDNKIVRAGGFGPFCGDEGSAYWLGKKVIELFTKQADSRLDITPIYSLVKESLKLSSEFDIISLIVDNYAMDRDRVAGLASYMHKAALLGDKYAIDMYRAAAYELFLLVCAIARKLNITSDDYALASYSGGVFKAGEFILKPLRELIESKYKGIELVEPVLRPATGAALYAMKQKTGAIEMAAIDMLVREEKRLKL